MNKAVFEKAAVEGRVSVVITCYNYGHFLSQAIESARAQNWPDLEILVINDGSTDDTDRVVQPFLSDSRIRYIKQQNGGQSRAKNAGIVRSTGEFIAFLDADDRWDAHKLVKQMPFFGRPYVGVVFSQMSWIDEDGNAVETESSSPLLNPHRGRVTNDLFLDNFVPFSSTVVRRSCFEQAGIMDETLDMGIDWDLWLRMSLYTEFDYVDEPLLFYRVGHAGQMSKAIETRQVCSDLVMDRFLNQNPHAVSAAVIRRARFHTDCNRGYYFRPMDLKRSTQHFVSAVKNRPWGMAGYRGLAKNGWVAVKQAAGARS